MPETLHKAGQWRRKLLSGFKLVTMFIRSGGPAALTDYTEQLGRIQDIKFRDKG